MPDISNTDDVIDSRDVIERIEELEESRKPFVAGWNMPGYMPDCEPARFATFEEAATYLDEEMGREADEAETAGTAEDLAGAQARLANAAGPEYGETVGRFHWFISHDAGPDSFESTEEHDEYQALKALADEASQRAADWEHGETLIRDSYFRTYAEELADEVSPAPANQYGRVAWPYTCIDWAQAARELQMDYTAVDFDGVRYWIR